MTSIDTSTLRPGQVVHIKATVERPKCSGLRLRLNAFTDVHFGNVEIVHVEPLPIAVGDEVRPGGRIDRPILKVRAIHGNLAWAAKDDTGSGVIFCLAELVRI